MKFDENSGLRKLFQTVKKGIISLHYALYLDAIQN